MRGLHPKGTGSMSSVLSLYTWASGQVTGRQEDSVSASGKGILRILTSQLCCHTGGKDLHSLAWQELQPQGGCTQEGEASQIWFGGRQVGHA